MSYKHLNITEKATDSSDVRIESLPNRQNSRQKQIDNLAQLARNPGDYLPSKATARYIPFLAGSASRVC